jgi:hypothetical protein
MRTLASLLAMMLVWPASAALAFGQKKQAKTQPRKNADTVVFAVSRGSAGSSVDPIVIINQGRYTHPPSGDSDISQLERFAGLYYRAGQKYRLMFGGGEAGAVTIKGWSGKDRDCSRTEGSAEIQSSAASARIGGKVMGLATNSRLLGRAESSRRFPTPSEREQVGELAGSIYRQKGVPASLRQEMKTINMTATDLDGDSREEIIATFLIKKPKGARAAHVLFVLAEPASKGFRAALTQYGHITEKDLMSGASFDDLGEEVLAEVLVDQLDLDRDGTAEVIIADTSFEGITYRIYKKQKGRWRKAYEFYNYRCAF